MGNLFPKNTLLFVFSSLFLLVSFRANADIFSDFREQLAIKLSRNEAVVSELRMSVYDLIGKLQKIVKSNPDLYAQTPRLADSQMRLLKELLRSKYLSPSKGSLYSFAIESEGEYTVVIPGNSLTKLGCGDQSTAINTLSQIAYSLNDKILGGKNREALNLVYDTRFSPSANEYETIFAQMYCTWDMNSKNELNHEQRSLVRTRNSDPSNFNFLIVIRIPDQETLERLSSINLTNRDWMRGHDLLVQEISQIKDEAQEVLAEGEEEDIIRTFEKIKALDMIGPLAIHLIEKQFDEQVENISLEEGWKFREARQKRNRDINGLNVLSQSLWDILSKS